MCATTKSEQNANASSCLRHSGHFIRLRERDYCAAPTICDTSLKSGQQINPTLLLIHSGPLFQASNMEPNNLGQQHSQFKLQQTQQQSQQQQQRVSADQLPDESYIEKLFPKCQPKQTQQIKGTNQFKSKKMINLNDRKHNKRTARMKQHQQSIGQHDQRPNLEGAKHPPAVCAAEQVDKNNYLNATHSTTLSNNYVKNNTLAHNIPSTNQYCESTNSSDKETNASSRNGTSGVKRSRSDQSGFNRTSVHRPDTESSQLKQPLHQQQDICTQDINRNPILPQPHYSKPKTRKYKASKNLQQQLKRSQSSYSKLINSQPLPVDLNDRNNDQIVGRTSLHHEHTNNQTQKSIQVNGPIPNGKSSDDLQLLRNSDKGKRTCRGIVFAEPVVTSAITSAAITTGNGNVDSQPNDSNGSTGGTENSHNAVVLPPSQTTYAQQLTSVDAADSSLTHDPQEVNATQDNALNISSQPYSYSNLSQQRISQEIITNELESSVKGVVTEDDDKFINLFVYDNTISNKSEEKESTDKEPSSGRTIIFKQHQSREPSDIVTSNNQTNRQLLGTVLVEDDADIISNDTSIEELCHFSDNDANSSIKVKSQSEFKKRETSNDDQDIELEKMSTNQIVNIPNKLILKHHRSISTLQTVDERAEAYIEEDNNVCSAESKIDLVDISESNMIQITKDQQAGIKKSVVLPGFPQRVKPSQNNNSSVNETHLSSTLTPTSSTNVPSSPTSGDDANENTVPDFEPQCSDINEVNPQTLNDVVYSELEKIGLTEESQKAIERNLSDALNKVSLDQSSNSEIKETNTSTIMKLPYEASHFSTGRPTSIKNFPLCNETHRSGIQFNILSDGESGPDEESMVQLRANSSSKANQVQTLIRQDISASITRYNGPGSSIRVNEDSIPATKTALVFPRLDEGLSSEAESCDDEEEDDDDKAMDADVDADDDDDEDDEDDDDVNSPTLNIDKSSTSIRMSVDKFVRQQQSLKPQNSMMGSLPQHSTIETQPQDQGMHQIKAQNQAYSTYINPEQLDQDDLKPLSSYPNQNGQSSYWMNMSSQQETMPSQPTQASQQFTIQRSQHSNNSGGNNVIASRSNSYVNREEVKSASRLSSDTDNETDRLLGSQRSEQLQKLTTNELVSSNLTNEQQSTNNFASKQGSNSREVLIEGVLFNVKYLGSTHTECEGTGEKEDRIHQAELAVHEVKFRNGEAHLPIEVQLFISTEKIMVLDDKHRKIMMDHSLRTISYIADIGDSIVLIVRKKSTSIDANNDIGRPISKTSCHVFESNESHTITKSISQAFQVAYTELLKANGGSDPSGYLPKELDYQEVLNSQEMSMTELEMFARKDNQREVIVPKKKGEILGLSIVESGWGSVLPTAVIASLKPEGPAYRCKKLSVGDQILSINGISLVGLSLAECQKILRKTKTQSVARLSVVPCPITVEVKIKRPDTKYQLGFSVQHGVICSLLRGGIAERGGVRVGHRIISINGTTVVGVPHDKIVTLLASSVGEIRMKTCLTSLYRHMLGEEKNVSFV